MSKYQKVYRVVENVNSNDFNNTIEYTILNYDLNTKNNKIRRCGWNDWHLATNDIIFKKENAEQKLVELCLERNNIQDLYNKELLIRVAKDSNNNVKLLYKALELACSTHQFEDNCDYCPYNQERLKTNACPCSCEDEPYFNRDCTINYFIQQAEKELREQNE